MQKEEVAKPWIVKDTVYMLTVGGTEASISDQTPILQKLYFHGSFVTINYLLFVLGISSTKGFCQLSLQSETLEMKLEGTVSQKFIFGGVSFLLGGYVLL